jgi:hypothetical protein
LARFRARHRIFDILERSRELARKRLENIRERTRRLTDNISKTLRERVRRDTDKTRAFNERFRERQLFRLKIDDPFFKLETLKAYTVDLLTAQGIIDLNKLRDAIKHGLDRIKQIDFTNLFNLEKCVARYHTGPCNSYKYYVKLTYATRDILRDLATNFVVYIRNWIANARLRDRLLNAIAFVIHALLRSRTKSKNENYNSEYLANTNSTLDDADNLEISRSDPTNTARSYSLGFLLRHPSFIARSLASKLGLAEYSSDSHHCSIYVQRAEISRRKHYKGLDFQQYYDFIIAEDRERFRGVK